MTGVAVWARAMVRVVLAVAIVTALFFMHGAVASGGCAAGAPVLPSSMAIGVAAFSGTTGAAGPARPAVDDTVSAVSAVSRTEHGHGQMCVSTPPRPVLAAPHPADITLTSIGYRDSVLSRPATDRRPRASPHGAELLVALCVSRT